MVTVSLVGISFAAVMAKRMRIKIGRNMRKRMRFLLVFLKRSFNLAKFRYILYTVSYTVGLFIPLPCNRSMVDIQTKHNQSFSTFWMVIFATLSITFRFYHIYEIAYILQLGKTILLRYSLFLF